jgi:hypothetical protein
MWTVPTGVTIIARPGGSGANDTVILAAFDSTYIFGSSISVRSMGCGMSAAKTLTIGGTLPTTPTAISGSTNVCEFLVSSTRPEGVIVTYTTRKVTGATSYAWAVSSGAEIIANPGGSGVNDTIIQVKYSQSFISGTVSVRSRNACGMSNARSLTVRTTKPTTPGSITTTLVSSCPNRVYRYSLAALPTNATSVNWTIPATGTIISQTSTSITVAYPTTAIAGTVSVVGINNCGMSSARTTTIRLTACPTGTSPRIDTEIPVAEIDAQIYPNPTTNYFNVRLLSNQVEVGQVSVFDPQGRLLDKQRITPGTLTQIGARLKPGQYLIRIEQAGSVKTLKAIKF